MALTEKFKKDVSTLRAASNGDFLLDVKNPKLYKKLFRYYQNEGAVLNSSAIIKMREQFFLVIHLTTTKSSWSMSLKTLKKSR
jgi:hypothetical protein